MSDLNVFSCTGNATKDAEILATKSGETICKFSIAINKKVKGVQSTLFVNCAMWGKFGQALQPWIKRGGKIAVSGEIKLDEYTGKDGLVHKNLSMKVDALTLLGGKPEGHGGLSAKGEAACATGGASSEATLPQEDGPGPKSDDIPF